MPTIPYLHFPGTCAEAMDLYADVFGGTDRQAMTYAEMPGAPPDWAASPRLMHAQMTIRGGTLMGSDYPPGMDGDAQAGVAVMQSMPDAATARAAFDRLAEGGAVIDPIRETFFSPAFGMVKDRFGTHWYLSAEAP